EGMIGLFKAVRDYDAGRDASFSTFADLCISRQMYSAIKSLSRKKHMPLNSYISIYASREDSDQGSDVSLEEILESDSNLIPEQYVLDQENLKILEENIDKDLSELERQVLDLYITGMSIKKIAGVLGRDEKSTDNAMQRVRAKLKKYLK
ncbi:MAG: sigma-70 family RNA polymerase sigma factor, partial [Butyrivibrio sp.]|nr:sigma-70 family RNA polymerase sigma factor [Butyrivibrio sp.]